ncbi:MAG TPA: hypothetical protein VJT71_20615 [Pyrinomonadaceae bacterium]|nr:hypothetical protein [Pyrinomonadaceae bacterium]
MIPPRQIRLMLAAILAMASTILVVATFNVSGTSSTPPDALKANQTSGSTLKSKILRRKDQLKSKLTANEISLLRRNASAQEERKVENEIPKHVPIKIKLKADKEKKFKDLDNPGWYRDFELEVTNTSSKPIYFLELWLVYPEINSGNGAPVGIPLRYGRMNFIEQKTVPIPTDVPIQPGETFVFTIPERDRKGWEAHKKHENTPDPKKVLLWFVQLSFGDGTGFDGIDANEYPYKNGKKSSLPCREGPATVAEGGPVNGFSTTFQAIVRNESLFPVTGRLSAGYFSALNGGYGFLRNSTPAPDICCGSGCFFMKPSMDSCACGASRGNSYPGCSDPEAACGIPLQVGHWCGDNGVYCPEYARGVCVTDAPSPPSPSPTPTPTAPPCDPATRPNNTNCFCDTMPYLIGGYDPQWHCGLFCSSGVGADYVQYPGAVGYAGCPPDRHNNQNDCCVCIFQACPGGSSVNQMTCECPSPTPTPDGNGGDGGQPPEPCTIYWWVLWESTDGGQSWHEIDRWYAGCW